MNPEIYYNYSDVLLIPNYSKVKSRSADCDVSFKFSNNMKFKLPVVPANMKASIDFEKAQWLAENGYFYIMHRFENRSETLNWIRHMANQGLFVSISIGVQDADKLFLEHIISKNLPVDFITIDIAHGDCEAMGEMIKFIQETFKDYFHGIPFIIAGNITTPSAAKTLYNKYKVNGIKVGIGCGRTCLTRLQTGFGLPMFTTIQKIKNAFYVTNKNVKLEFERPLIIADGGINHFGDATKAFVAGADMVMAGSMFAKCVDSPSETTQELKIVGNAKHTIGPIYKKWYGSASEYNKGKYEHVEGFEIIEETNYRTYSEFLIEWEQALQSSCSYGGAFNIEQMKTQTNWAINYK